VCLVSLSVVTQCFCADRTLIEELQRTLRESSFIAYVLLGGTDLVNLVLCITSSMT
jgi:hypothetical protein